MTAFDLELSVLRRAEGVYVGALRAELANHRAELTSPTPLALNLEALQALSLDPHAYGAALSAMAFPAPLREGWRQALGFQQSAVDVAFRVRLHLDDDPVLHTIRWELLQDPIRYQPIAISELSPFSRYLGASDMRDVQADGRPELRVVIAAASPAVSFLPPIDTAGEAWRVRGALGDIPVTILDNYEGRPAASLPAIATELRDGANVLVLVCHGAMVDGEPFLWLEQPDSAYTPVPGATMVETIAQLERRPLLVVLGACQSAGNNFEVWGAIGPQLARVGVASVLAMQGDIPIVTAQLLLSTFFRELRRDGTIDRALAVARAALGPSHPWWMPVLWSRVRDGRLWREPASPHRLNWHLSRAALDELRDQIKLAMQAYELHLRTAPRRAMAAPEQPYKFLYSFDVEDAGRFFGRDHALQALSAQARSTRLTVLQAPSGTGKSSLIKAGLVLRLLDASILTVVARATSDPLAALKRALLPPSTPVPDDVIEEMGLAELLGLVWSCVAHTFQAVVIVIDQLEEFFVAIPEPEGRHVVAAELARCLEDTAVPLRVLLSIRSDYFAELTHFQPRIPGIFHSVYRLEPLSRREALDAITEPLRRLTPPRVYHPDVLGRLLQDLDRSGVEPPQLQIVCTRIFEHLRPDKTEITLTHYESLGGAEGVLRDYIRESLARLGGRAPLARSVLTALVSPEGARQSMTQRDLEPELPGSLDRSDLSAVLATLVADRLLRRDEQDGLWRYELAHDYMLGEIREWIIQDDSAVRLARDSVRQGVVRWHSHGWLLDTRDLGLIERQPALLTQLRPSEAELLLRSSLAAGLPAEAWAAAALRLGVDVWTIIGPLLRQGTLNERTRAISVLPAIGDAALAELGAALVDPLPLIRTSAITALERLGTESSRTLLAHELRWEVSVPIGNGQRRLYVDRGPVTCAEYELFLATGGEYPPPKEWGGPWAPRGAARYPVTGVSWDDAAAYARWAGRRLLTHEEWVLAAGGKGGYPWGPRFSPERCNTRESGSGWPSPVGAYSPAGDSPYGVTDLAGNVWEWLAAEPGGGALRRLAGGAWSYSALYARIDAEGLQRDPAAHQPDIGFRLCFDVIVTKGIL